MWVLIFLNFLFSCCLSVFFYTQLKNKEDDINELFDMYYLLYNLKETNKENKELKKKKVFKLDRWDF